ncbi:C-X-C motif chemokine 19 [Corythoichthys intestinalis]|uniref:C-X-C motif chemokine 19 n=1 Tax=Corythoichthys intestinalis TaxID=161448 RepID=UPI0025A5AD6C|nr:C-X-C motif chemokine 19 [Corythoichthys intestinalis]XP_061810837.1 interleukin-8-like [Nerophis lumbriciformis]
MKICSLLSFGVLLASVGGMPPISRDYNTRCRCLRAESRIIPPDSLRSIKVVPEGSHCTHTEIIAILVSGEQVCLDSQSSWVKKLVHFVLEKQPRKRSGANSRRPA